MLEADSNHCADSWNDVVFTALLSCTLIMFTLLVLIALDWSVEWFIMLSREGLVAVETLGMNLTRRRMHCVLVFTLLELALRSDIT